MGTSSSGFPRFGGFSGVSKAIHFDNANHFFFGLRGCILLCAMSHRCHSKQSQELTDLPPNTLTISPHHLPTPVLKRLIRFNCKIS